MNSLLDCNISEQYNPIILKAKRIAGITDYRNKFSIEYILLTKTKEQKEDVIRAINEIKKNIPELFNQPGSINAMEVLKLYCKGE